MDCINCKHRGTVPGSHHSSCNLIGGELATKTLMALRYLKGERIHIRDSTGKETPLIEIDSHGVKNGWANWPIDFDPIWVSNCIGFTSKTTEHETNLSSEP